MAESGSQTGESRAAPDRVERILTGLTCPNCEYSLRGLGGEVVTCPECGSRLDVSRLISARWTGPWQTAPGYGRIVLPVGVAAAGALFTFAASVVEHADTDLFIAMEVVAGLTVLTWVFVLTLVTDHSPAPNSISLALLAHVLFVGYIAALALLLTGAVRAITAGMAVESLTWSVAALISVPVWIACRRGERFIAQQCIRGRLRAAARI